MRNGSLWSNIVFEKVVISHSNNKKLQTWSLYKMILKAHKKGVFMPIFSCNFDEPIEPNRPLVCYWYMVMLRSAKWEYWSLTITKGVQCLYQQFCWILMMVNNVSNWGEYAWINIVTNPMVININLKCLYTLKLCSFTTGSTKLNIVALQVNNIVKN